MGDEYIYQQENSIENELIEEFSTNVNTSKIIESSDRNDNSGSEYIQTKSDEIRDEIGNTPKAGDFNKIEPPIPARLVSDGKLYDFEGYKLEIKSEGLIIIEESTLWYKVKIEDEKIVYAKKNEVTISETDQLTWLTEKRKVDQTQRALATARKKQIDSEIKEKEYEYYKKRRKHPKQLQDVNQNITENTLEIQNQENELNATSERIVEVENQIVEAEKTSAIRFNFAKPDLDKKNYGSFFVKLWNEIREEIEHLKEELQVLQTTKEKLILNIDDLKQESETLLDQKKYLETGKDIKKHNKNIKQRSKLEPKIEKREAGLKKEIDKKERKIGRKKRKGKSPNKEDQPFKFEKRIQKRIQKKAKKQILNIANYNVKNQEINKKRQSFLSGDLSEIRDEYKIKSIDQNPDKTLEKKESVEDKSEISPTELAKKKILNYSTKEKATQASPMTNADVVAVFYFLMNKTDLSSEELEGIRWYMKFHINDSNIYDIFGYTEDKIDPETFLKKIKGKALGIKDIYIFFKRLVQDKHKRKENPSLVTKTGNKKKRKEDRRKKRGVKGNYRKKGQLSDMSSSIAAYKKEVKKVENLNPEKRQGDINVENHYVFSMMKFNKHFYLDTFQLYVISKSASENDEKLRKSAESYYNKYIGRNQSDLNKDKATDPNFETFFAQLTATNGLILYENFMGYLDNGIPASPQRVYEDFMAYLHPIKLGALKEDVYDLRKARTKKTADRLLKGLQVDYKILLPKDQNTPIALYETVHTLQQEWAGIQPLEQKQRLYPIYHSLGGKMNETEFNQNFDDGNISLGDILTRTVPKEYVKSGKLIHPEQAYHDFFIGLLDNISKTIFVESGVSEFIQENTKTIGVARNIAMTLLNSINNPDANFDSLGDFMNYMEGWVAEVTILKEEWEKETLYGNIKKSTDMNISTKGIKDEASGKYSDLGVANTTDGTTFNLHTQFGIKQYRWVDGKLVESFSLQSGAYLQNQWVSGNTTDPSNLNFFDISHAMLKQNTLVPKYDRNKHESPSFTSGFSDYYAGRPTTTFSRTTWGADLALKKNFYLDNLIIGLSGGGSYQFNQYSGTIMRDLPLLPLETKVQTQVLLGKLGMEFLFNNGLGFNFAYTGIYSSFQGNAFENEILQEDMSQVSSQYVQKATMMVSYNGINGVFNIGNDTKGTYLDLKFGTDLNLLFPGSIAPGKYEIELQYNHTTWDQNPELKIPSNSINLFGIRLIKRL